MINFKEDFFELYKEEFESHLATTIGLLKYLKIECEKIGDMQGTAIYDRAIKAVCIGLNAASNDYEFIEKINEKDIEPDLKFGDPLHFVIDHLQAFLIYLLVKDDKETARSIKDAYDILMTSERLFMYKIRPMLERYYTSENEYA